MGTWYKSGCSTESRSRVTFGMNKNLFPHPIWAQQAGILMRNQTPKKTSINGECGKPDGHTSVHSEIPTGRLPLTFNKLSLPYSYTGTYIKDHQTIEENLQTENQKKRKSHYNFKNSQKNQTQRK